MPEHEPSLPIDSVFHATDFSAASELAFAHALRIAVAARCELDILHAGDGRDGPRWQDFPSVRGMLEAWGLLEPGSRPEDVGRLGLHVEKVEARGMQPVEAIRGYLRDHPAQLLVLATHGREGLPRWIHTAVAEPVAREAHAATLFVPHGARGFVSQEDGGSDLRRILVPVDREPRAQPAVAMATALARALGASQLRLVAVHAGAAGDMLAVHPPADGSGVTFEREARDGPVLDAILDAARDHDAQLVAMTTRGHHGFLDVLRGSTSEQVVRRAPCPVLAIPET